MVGATDLISILTFNFKEQERFYLLIITCQKAGYFLKKYNCFADNAHRSVIQLMILKYFRAIKLPLAPALFISTILVVFFI